MTPKNIDRKDSNLAEAAIYGAIGGLLGLCCAIVGFFACNHELSLESAQIFISVAFSLFCGTLSIIGTDRFRAELVTFLIGFITYL
jgi:ABC-type antimicrobial peptide transport system permease subunit